MQTCLVSFFFILANKNTILQGLANLMFCLITWTSAENPQNNDFKSALAGKPIIEKCITALPESIIAKTVVIFDDEQS